MTSALSDGSLQCKPNSAVLEGRGLKNIQNGLDMVRRGVSATKVVVWIADEILE
jgi:hypothetical protein